MDHKLDELIKQLKMSPESEILGVVGVDGVGRVGIGPPENIQWSIHITLSRWKQPGTGLRKSEMTVRKWVPDEAAALAFPTPKDGDIIRIKARWSECNVLGSPQALLTEFIGTDDSDPELNACALKLRKPVTFTDAEFGVFMLDRGLDLYVATTDWCGGSIQLMIPAGMRGKRAMALNVARRLWAEQDLWRQRIAACATRDLLALRNKSWRSDDEQETTENEFACKMVVESISVAANGSFEFWHDDGNLFWGHLIMVRGNLSDGPTHAEIHG